MQRVLVALGGALGALAVGLGAFGAHGLERFLEGSADAADRHGWWETAALYHLVHAVAIAVASRIPARAAYVGAFAHALGIALFSGTLYAMALGAPRWLGAVTPIGGLALIVGWIAIAFAALRKTP